jgi:thioredoxin 1
MNRKLRIAILLLVALAVAAVLFWERGGEPSPRAEAPNTPQLAEITATPAVAALPPDSTKAAKPAALPRLVDLGSNTCIPCKKMAPILAELAVEQAGRLEVLVIDIREDQAAAAKYGIRLIPTQVFYDAAGKEVWRHEGFIDKAAILARWAELGVSLAAAESLAP